MQKKPLSVYVTSAVYNYNGTEVMGSYNDDDIYLFDTSKPTGTNYAHKYEGHRNSETGKYLKLVYLQSIKLNFDLMGEVIYLSLV